MIQGERNNNIDCTTTIKLIRHFVYYTKHNNSHELFLMSNSILEFFIEISVFTYLSLLFNNYKYSSLLGEPIEYSFLLFYLFFDLILFIEIS